MTSMHFKGPALTLLPLLARDTTVHTVDDTTWRASLWNDIDWLALIVIRQQL